MSKDEMGTQIDEPARRRFEVAWRNGQPEAIERCLPTADHPLYLPTLVELVLIELEFLWKAHGRLGDATAPNWDRPRVEDYLQRFPLLNEPTLLLQLLQQEYRVRVLYGDRPAAAEFRERFPEVTITGTEVQPTVPQVGMTGHDLPAMPGYEILGRLGRGAMGVVYKARQVGLDRIVALKRILADTEAGPEHRARFRTEAEALARLQHPHIVQIHEVGEHQGQPYLALEFVAGGSLAQFLAGIPQPPRQAARLLECLARAVQAAHERGILHRDLKPANVLLAPKAEIRKPKAETDEGGSVSEFGLRLADFEPKVSDFGLAKRLDQPGVHTQSGDVLGTPAYMAPEQASGKTKETGPAADVWALGAILYEMLTGRPPFRGETALVTLQQVIGDEVVPPARLQSQVPRDLETICLKCLEKQPPHRFASALALAEDLRRWCSGEPIQARPVGAWERGVKWARRQPVLAALFGLIFLTVLMVVGFVVGLFYNAQLRESRDLAKSQEAEAQTQRQRAEEQQQIAERERASANKQRDVARQQKTLARRSQYLAQMLRAQQMGEENEIPRMLELLQANQQRGVPSATDPPDQEDLRGFEWHYLHRLSRSLLTLGGYEGHILDVAFSPDGARLASACWDGKVRVHDSRSGQEVLTVKGAKQLVCCVAFSPDGKRLAAGAQDYIQVWDALTGRELLKPIRTAGMVYSLAFSADGTQIASAGQSAWDKNTVVVWDAVTGAVLQKFNSRSDSSYRVVFSPDGKSLIAAGESGVLIWDAHTGAQRFVLPGEKQVTNVDVSPDGLLLAAGGKDGAVTVWEAQTGKLLRKWKGHTGEVNRVAFSPDSKRLASAGEDLILKVWDPETGQELLTLGGHTYQVARVYLAPSRPGITGLAFSPDGRRLASAAGDRTVRVWDATPRQETLLLQGFSGPIAGVSFSADGRRVALIERNQHNPPKGIAFSNPKGKTAGVRIFDVATGQEVRKLERKRVGEDVLAAVLSPDGQRLALAIEHSDTVRVWEVTTGQEILTLTGHVRGVTSVAFSPDGRRLAVAAHGMVRIWDAAGKLFVAFDKTKDHLLQPPTPIVAFSPDGKQVVTASSDPDFQFINVMDAETGKEIHRLDGHGWSVKGLAFSPDGKRIVTASGDNTVILWDAATGKPLVTFRGHSGQRSGVNCVAFNPEGTMLVSGGDDHTVRLWDADTGQEALTLKGHRGPVRAVTFSPDGQRIFSLGDEGVLRAWDGRPVQLPLPPR